MEKLFSSSYCKDYCEAEQNTQEAPASEWQRSHLPRIYLANTNYIANVYGGTGSFLVAKINIVVALSWSFVSGFGSSL